MGVLGAVTDGTTDTLLLRCVVASKKKKSPFSSMSLNICKYPDSAQSCNAVFPLMLFRLTSAFRPRRNLTMLRWPWGIKKADR